MKIKVDKKEYESLLLRVAELEDKVESAERYAHTIMERMRAEIESFFDRKCRVVMIKRDKEMLAAELRSQAMNNIFKEESK